VGVRFPWGSVLALRCGSLSAPLDVASGGLSPASAIVAFVTGCLHTTPTIRVAREGRVDEAIRCRQLQPIAIRRTSETGAFSAPRMRTPRGPSRTLWSLHRVVSTSDVPVVTRRHTRVDHPSSPDVLTIITHPLLRALSCESVMRI
jgi:hypothetical protein